MATFTINEKRNTDWDMDFLRKTISAAAPKTRTVDIPLRDGVIDITESSDGVVRYRNRQITMNCEIRKPRIEWPHLQMELANLYHGKIVTVSFGDDPDHYWIGRMTVGAIQDNTTTANITFTLDAEPFRRTTDAIKVSEITLAANADEQVSINLLGHARGYIMLVPDGTEWSAIDIVINGIPYRVFPGTAIRGELLPALTESMNITFRNEYALSQKFTYKVVGGDL